MQDMQSGHTERCIVLPRGDSSVSSSYFMVDRLQDKVTFPAFAFATQYTSDMQRVAQVNYLDGRIGDFAAAFEDATGCHPSHPVYAACQVQLSYITFFVQQQMCGSQRRCHYT